MPPSSCNEICFYILCTLTVAICATPFLSERSPVTCVAEVEYLVVLVGQFTLSFLASLGVSDLFEGLVWWVENR